MNQFVNSVGSHDTTTWNGALSHSTSGSYILDYFAKAGTYQGRSQDEVNRDMERIFGENEELALRTLCYLRMVTRKVKIAFDEGERETETVQKGQGRKDEFIKALNWMRKYRPAIYEKLLVFVPELGSWKDLWYDNGQVQHYAPTDVVFSMLGHFLMDNTDSMNAGLIAKYLPQYRTNRKSERQARRNKWATDLASYLQLDGDKWMRPYKKLKSSPEFTAHSFQRVMSSGQWDKLDFNKIPGKALFKLLKKSTLANHGLLPKFTAWLKTQKTVPFTGYVYELAKYATGNEVQRLLVDKQFQTLLGKAGDLNGNILVALDTSGSMSSEVIPGVRAVDICMSLGVWFSAQNKGDFKDLVCMFDSTSRWQKLSGSFSDRVRQIPANAMGSTNFQSVIDLIIDKRLRNPNIPVSDFPETIVVVSDMQFNVAGYGNYYGRGRTQTNYEALKAKFERVGLEVPHMVWWYVNGSSKDVTVKAHNKATTLISGFDPSVLNMIVGTEVTKAGEKVKLTAYESMLKALDQELINVIVSQVL